MIKNILNNKLSVVNGLEGSGKSSAVFKEMNKLATTRNPVLFAFKNYHLMVEQLNSWSERFGIKKEEFCICGFNPQYEPGFEAYTNPDKPWSVSKEARFVFITQASVQRNKHWHLKKNNKSIGWCHIIVDEFDFSTGIIPTFNYMVNYAMTTELSEEMQKKLFSFVRKNYTEEDAYLSQKAIEDGKKFEVAHWISSSAVPITFLTSEILATLFLQNIGFHTIFYGDKEKKDCKVYFDHKEYISKPFFEEMNKSVLWNKLPYDVIISDLVDMDASEKLEVAVVNHTSVRGSNKFTNTDKKLLTILSHIPKKAIGVIKDAFNYFAQINGENKELSFKETSALFYRDRIMQAVGRTIGYRGGNEAYLLCHSSIWDGIDELAAHEMKITEWMSSGEEKSALLEELFGKELFDHKLITSFIQKGVSFFPYTFCFDSLDREILGEIEERVLDMMEKRKEECKNNRIIRREGRKIKTLSILGDYYRPNEKSFITNEEIKKYNDKWKIHSVSSDRVLTASKVAAYFNLPVVVTKVNGKSVRSIKGLEFVK